jgi:hypothetical protein
MTLKKEKIEFELQIKSNALNEIVSCKEYDDSLVKNLEYLLSSYDDDVFKNSLLISKYKHELQCLEYQLKLYTNEND